MAGIVPGLLIAALLMIYAFYYCKKHGEDKAKINEEVNALHNKGFKKVFFESFWALLTPVIILGCIYSGVASPTEAAVISVFYALFISMFIYKSLRVKDLYDVFVESIKTFAPILFILASAVAFSRIITLLQIPDTAANFIVNTIHGQVAVMCTNAYRINRIMVIDDKASLDDFAKKTLKLSVPQGVALSVLPVKKASERINEGIYDNQRVFIVVKNIDTLYRLLMDYPISIEEVNLGNQTYHDGYIKIRSTISFNKKEIEQLKEISKKGVRLIYQLIPQHPQEILNKEIEQL